MVLKTFTKHGKGISMYQPPTPKFTRTVGRHRRKTCSLLDSYENYKVKNYLWKDTKHIRHIHMKDDKNNNRMERLNGTIKDREVAYRDIKKMTSHLFDGFQTFYNFSKKHGSLDKRTPTECAWILVEGNNKWKTIIQNASLNE